MWQLDPAEVRKLEVHESRLVFCRASAQEKGFAWPVEPSALLRPGEQLYTLLDGRSVLLFARAATGEAWAVDLTDSPAWLADRQARAATR